MEELVEQSFRTLAVQIPLSSTEKMKTKKTVKSNEGKLIIEKSMQNLKRKKDMPTYCKVFSPRQLS